MSYRVIAVPSRKSQKSPGRAVARGLFFWGALCALTVVCLAAEAGDVVRPASTASREDGFAFRVSVPPPVLTPAEDGSVAIEIDGFPARLASPGAPDLPSRIVRVAIPPGVTPRIDVRILDERLRPGVVPRAVPYRIYEVPPQPEPDLAPEEILRRRDELGDPVRERLVRRRDPARFAKAGPTAAPATLGETGVLRYQRYVEILLTPARFDAERHGLRFAREFEVDVRFDGSWRAGTGRSPSEGAFERAYREAFLNYAQGTSFRLRGPGVAVPGTAAVEAATSDTGILATSERWRIRVRENGVIRIDHGRMVGTEILSEPLSSWKVTGQGLEVPVRVHDFNGNDLMDPPGVGNPSGDWIQFWGQALDGDPETEFNFDMPGDADLYEARDYSDENVYFLTAEAGPRLRMATREAIPGAGAAETEFQETVREEVEDAFRPLGAADPWYWLPTLDSDGNPDSAREIQVPLPGLASAAGPVTVRVNLRGTSESSSVNPDHRSRITLKNALGQTLASDDDDGTFDGRSLFLHEFVWSYPGSGPDLGEPARIAVDARPVAGLGSHQMLVDYVEIDYGRTFTAVGDFLAFTWPDGDTIFEVGGLDTAPEIYEITGLLGNGVLRDAVRLTGASVSGPAPYSARFRIDQDPSLPDGTPRRFVVVGSNSVTVPSGNDFTFDTVSDLRNAANDFDIVVVAHPDVLDDPANCADSILTQLLDHRLIQDGLTSLVTCMEDVRDEFNFGLEGPRAIEEFLRYALGNWAGPPQYVLFLGDGSYEYKSGPSGGNFVPTQIMFKDDPSLGYYASDNVIAAVTDGDQLPDFIAGRISSRSVAQTHDVLQKILDYEQTAPSGSANWPRHVLLVSDRGKNYDENESCRFEELNEIGASKVKDPPHTIRRLRYWTDNCLSGGGDCNGATPETPQCNPFAMHDDIEAAIRGTDGFSDGVAMMQVTSHGNFDLWSDDVFFCGNEDSPFCVADDTQALDNGHRLPWLIVNNCLTGGFHTPSLKTMGEQWLEKAGGGALAVYAPSGLGYRYIGEEVTEVIWEGVFGRYKERRIGDPILRNLVNLCGRGSIEACQYHVLLGDPVTRLWIPSVEPATAPSATGGNSQVVLNWTHSTDHPNVTYDVWRATGAPSALYSVVGSSSSNQFVDDSAVNARTYFYYVVAVDPEGFESRWSNFNSDCDVEPPGSRMDCVEATPLNPDPPSAPTGVVVTDPESGGRLDVTWSPNPEDDLDYYEVHYGKVSGGYTNVNVVRNSTAHSLLGLDNGETYYVAVTATNTSGNTSAFSIEASGVPTFVLGLRAPEFISDLVLSKSGTDAVLDWSAVTHDIYGKDETVSYYEVFRGTTPGFVPSEANRITPPGGITVATFTDPGALAPGGPDYHYLVRAVDVDGNAGGLGRELPAWIEDMIVAKSGTTPGNLVLTWAAVETVALGTAPTVVDHYDVYASDQPFSREDVRDGAAFVDLLTTTTGTGVEVAPPATRRYYSVIVVDSRGNESPY